MTTTTSIACDYCRTKSNAAVNAAWMRNADATRTIMSGPLYSGASVMHVCDQCAGLIASAVWKIVNRTAREEAGRG